MPQNLTVRSRVLVVDDAPEIRLLATHILAGAGYDVLATDNGQDALTLAQEQAPGLILLDVMMPGMDGYEVCTRLKAAEETRAVPVIFMSASTDTEAQTRGFAVGAADFVTKPIGAEVLLARVKTHLALYAQRRSLEGMFRDVIEFAPDAFILTDPLGRIVQVNARTEQLFGHPRDELIGQGAEILVPQGLRAATDARCLRQDGTEFAGDISLNPLQTNRGRLLMAVVRDVTERQQHEARLREAARYARSLIETSTDPLVLIDLQGKVQDANEAACRITGVPREQLIGSDAPNWFVDPQALINGYKQVMAEGEALDYELTIKHASGRRYDVLCNAKAFRNAQGELVGLFATAHDVTESRRIQQEISASRQRLREMAAQSEAMREFERKSIAREVHDELGQVLTALRMDLTFMGLKFGAETSEVKEKIDGMRALVDRAIQGVRDVATNLRPSALDMGLVPAIEWICGEFTRNTGVACDLDLQVPELAEQLGENQAVGLFRIVQESLTNITRYARANQVWVALHRWEESLRLRVRDNGLGFDPAQALQRKSFGLLGMQERALALGGTLDIQSAPGQGTCIIATVPIPSRQLGDKQKETP
jgi:PAS domain S-box-containing protein